MHDRKQTTVLALGRRATVNLVRWGVMEEGLTFRGWGEGDLAPTLYEWGIGRENHAIQTHFSEMWGKL